MIQSIAAEYSGNSDNITVVDSQMLSKKYLETAERAVLGSENGIFIGLVTADGLLDQV